MPQRGFTLIEVALAVALVALLAAIAVPSYVGFAERGRVAQAISDMGRIQLAADRFRLNNNDELPASLAEIELDTLLDPWGRPYEYLNISLAKNQGELRKDKNLVPLNTDFDLYSKGPDGDSKRPLNAKASRDDIVRANNGAFVGKAEDY
ncbi:MAG: prepilin-type N-terminal cleavage/methylation domain-containing protein [Gammaproteobacteria bacterium]